MKGFYKGLFPNYIKSVPAVAINYMVFEKTKYFLREHTDF